MLGLTIAAAALLLMPTYSAHPPTRRQLGGGSDRSLIDEGRSLITGVPPLFFVVGILTFIIHTRLD